MESFPDEILELIIRYLKGNDIKNLSLVSPRFSKLFENSPRYLTALQLNLSPIPCHYTFPRTQREINLYRDHNKNYNEIYKLKRRYNSVNIAQVSNSREESATLINILLHRKDDIKHITFLATNNIQFRRILKTLEELPHLQSIKISCFRNLSYTNCYLLFLTLSTIQTLRKITFVGDWANFADDNLFTQIPKNNSITSIELLQVSTEFPPNTGFIANCLNLENLKLISNYPSPNLNLFYENLTINNTKLKYLHICPQYISPRVMTPQLNALKIEGTILSGDFITFLRINQSIKDIT